MQSDLSPSGRGDEAANPLFTMLALPSRMDTVRSNSPDAALMSLETAAASARGGFACEFSSSDEYESALILERHLHYLLRMGIVAAPQEHDPVGLGYRQRLDQDGLRDAEDRGDGSDGHREDHHHRRR